MRNLSSRNNKGFLLKNSYQYKLNKSNLSNLKRKMKGNSKMGKLNLKLQRQLTFVIALAILLTALAQGCGDSNVADVQSSEYKVRGAGEKLS